MHTQFLRMLNYFRPNNLTILTALGLSLFANVAAAQAIAKPALNSTDTLWMSICAILVFMMTVPGLIMFYAGLVRRKNALFTSAQIIAVTAVVTLAWLVIGYSLAFTAGNTVIGGITRVFGLGLFDGQSAGLEPTVPEAVYFLFQLSFAVITTALVVGATVERMRMSVTIAFSALWVVLVYAPVAHWVWFPSGWLATLGHIDWAGGTVVHLTAGASGLAAAMVLGARHGFPKEPTPPQNLMLSAMGACFLWIGWFGFNGGSALSSAAALTAQVLLITFLSGCMGALTWGLCEAFLKRKITSLGLITGTIVGLVSITPAAGYVGINAAFVMPVIAAVFSYLALQTVKSKLGIDDTLDVFAIHGMAGIVGSLLTPMFATDDVAKAISHTLANGIGVVAVMIFSGLMTLVILKTILLFAKWRVSADSEMIGLDLSQLGETLEHVN